MSPIATDYVACSVGCDHELCKSSWSSHNAVQDVDLHVGPRKHGLDWDQDPCERRGQFWGRKGANPGHARHVKRSLYSKWLSRGQTGTV